MSLCAIVAAIAGAIGIILLSIYDTAHYPKMHDRCLAVFMFVDDSPISYARP